MEINGFGWHERERPPTSQELIEATRPYYEHTIEQFGVDRCMFESNFPVDKVTCSYNVLWNSFKRLVAQYSAAEKAQLFHDTAMQWSKPGAHLLLQTRVKTLDGELSAVFKRWYPDMDIEIDEMPAAA
jgi:hypothetical protein